MSALERDRAWVVSLKKMIVWILGLWRYRGWEGYEVTKTITGFQSKIMDDYTGDLGHLVYTELNGKEVFSSKIKIGCM